MTTGFAQNFLPEPPSRTRERITDVLFAIKEARGAAHSIDLETVRKALVEPQGSPWRADSDKQAKHYALTEKHGLIMNLELYTTRNYDSNGKEGEKFIMMVYKASSAIGYINLNDIEGWLEHIEKDTSARKTADSAA